MQKSAQKRVKEPIPRDIFNILACPLCSSELEYAKDKKSLVCSECGTKYPIENSIPILLPPKRKNINQ